MPALAVFGHTGIQSDFSALIASLPFLGIGGGIASVLLPSRRSARSLQLLKLLGCTSALLLAGSILIWFSQSSCRVAVDLGENFRDSFLVIDGRRLGAAALVSVTAFLSVVLVLWETKKLSRSYSFGLCWIWAFTFWAIFLDNSALRPWVCTLLSILFAPVLLSSSSMRKTGLDLLYCLVPFVGSSLLWLIAGTVGASTTWPRIIASICFLTAIPLPGLLRLWTKFTLGGVLLCQIAGATLGLLFLGEGVQAPELQWFFVLTALFSAAAAATSNNLKQFCFYAMLSFMHQGVGVAFLGDSTGAFLYLALVPFGFFALSSYIQAGGFSQLDTRLRGPVKLPRWSRWAVSAALICLFSGLIPGRVLALKLRVLAAVSAATPWGNLFLAAMLTASFLLLIGVIRFQGIHVQSAGGSAVPEIFFSLAACFMAGISPYLLAMLSSPTPHTGPAYIPWLIPVPLVCALLTSTLTPKEEGTARLWSGTTPMWEYLVHTWTAPSHLASPVYRVSLALRSLDRAANGLFAFVWAALQAAGRALRSIENRAVPFVFLVVLWRFLK